MNRRSLLALAVLALIGTSGTVASAKAQKGTRFIAQLRGDNEVPPVNTQARGTAFIAVDPRGNKVMVTLKVAKISDVTMAHFHMGPSGQNGGVVAFLYGPADPAGAEKGVLSTMTVTKGNLVGDLAGQPLSALVEQMNAGNIYVNVHTSAHGSGEIRGQVEAKGR